ncbi:MAG: DEAD/DEAH box helicase [Candidatus Hydrogenedentes bacterium]|nr:DEAD/DEAH box helicase [Candidatus Hydrogenedentota bacterium]
MVREIAESGGREVFFAGTLNGDGVVESVRVCARGHESAVPAFFEAVGTREVVIHNHPSGLIAPSEADLELAAIFGRHGNGVFIVDNEVARVYVVVEPFFQRQLSQLSPDELTRSLKPNGKLARALPHFEVRPQQSEMMASVARAFNTDGISVIEAPTGVGKTLAYLLPAVQWAIRNRERVVISTKTINLQEQIVLKDIPVLARCIEDRFTCVLVKGRSNYLCQRKLRQALTELTLFEDQENGPMLKAIAEWAKTTEDGSLSDLPFVPARDVWERLCSEADTCHVSQCPTPSKCFIGRARREMAKADLLVVNHSMLFADMAVKKELGAFTAMGVLPSYQRLVFDEAHHIEDSATEYFGAETTRNGALAALGFLLRVEGVHERGLLPFVRAKLSKLGRRVSAETYETILNVLDNQLCPSIAAAREAVISAFSTLRSLTAERCGQIGRDIKWRLTPEVLRDPQLREAHSVYVLPAMDEILTCVKECNRLLAPLKSIEAAPDETEAPFLTEMTQLNAYRDRLIRVASVLAEVTSEDCPANTVRWIEIDARNETIVRLARCPLEVAESLSEWVYRNLKSVVMTSATLSVQRRFDYLFSRIGLDRVGERNVEALALDSPFDFESQALLCLPNDIAAPDHPSFMEEAVDHIREALSITRGHAFVLFTSFYALDFTFKRLEGDLRRAGIAALKQGSATRTQLLDRFRKDTSSVLFATDSFWEGVDVAGDALQCVILHKLPFRVPTEPILEARAEAIDSSGGNSFMAYTVPQAVIKFRQGFGRLIRRATDRGAILVLDRRIITKYYGKVFLDSLPGVRVVKGPRAGVYMALRNFFNTPPTDGK